MAVGVGGGSGPVVPSAGQAEPGGDGHGVEVGWFCVVQDDGVFAGVSAGVGEGVHEADPLSSRVVVAGDGVGPAGRGGAVLDAVSVGVEVRRVGYERLDEELATGGGDAG